MVTIADIFILEGLFWIPWNINFCKNIIFMIFVTQGYMCVCIYICAKNSEREGSENGTKVEAFEWLLDVKVVRNAEHLRDASTFNSFSDIY